MKKNYINISKRKFNHTNVYKRFFNILHSKLLEKFQKRNYHFLVGNIGGRSENGENVCNLFRKLIKSLKIVAPIIRIWFDLFPII